MGVWVFVMDPSGKKRGSLFCGVLISDPRRGCFIVLSMFILFIYFFFFPPRFCRCHISGTVTRRDSKLIVLLGPVV